jgi:hypothetical protein
VCVTRKGEEEEEEEGRGGEEELPFLRFRVIFVTETRALRRTRVAFSARSESLLLAHQDPNRPSLFLGIILLR